MKSLKIALVGRDVSRSDSPKIHKFIGECLGYEVEFEKISISENEFAPRICRVFDEFDGFNVTIPYKREIMSYLDNLDGDARIIGAVNTVRAKTKTGYNTDGVGFMMMCEDGGIDFSGKDVLIIGAGGAGRCVAAKLVESGANVFIINRTFEKAKAVAEDIKGVVALEKIQLTPYYALINASGVGMHETEGVSPVGEEIIKNCFVAIDLIYKPSLSRFLKIASKLGKKIINGAAMLFYQAYFAECIYSGLTPKLETAKELFEKFKKTSEAL